MKRKTPIEINKQILILLVGLILSLVLILIYLSIPKDNMGIKDVNVGINPPIGNINAKIVIIEFSDFQCPACKAVESIVDDIIDKYGDDIVFYYRNFPLSIHENSFVAAEAAECANEQSKFWEYHDVLFANQGSLDKDNLRKYAKDIGLNEQEFNLCLDNENYKNIVLNDLSDAKKLNLKGTPTFFINGREVFGADEKKMIEVIEEEFKNGKRNNN